MSRFNHLKKTYDKFLFDLHYNIHKYDSYKKRFEFLGTVLIAEDYVVQYVKSIFLWFIIQIFNQNTYKERVSCSPPKYSVYAIYESAPWMWKIFSEKPIYIPVKQMPYCARFSLSDILMLKTFCRFLRILRATSTHFDEQHIQRQLIKYRRIM